MNLGRVCLISLLSLEKINSETSAICEIKHKEERKFPDILLKTDGNHWGIYFVSSIYCIP
jgi:hypothetical protein